MAFVDFLAGYLLGTGVAVGLFTLGYLSCNIVIEGMMFPQRERFRDVVVNINEETPAVMH